MAIGLGECLPELRQRDAPARLRSARGDWTGVSMSHEDPPWLGLFPAKLAPIRQLQERRNPDYGEWC